MAPKAVLRCGLAAALFVAGSMAQSQQAAPSPRLQLCMACHGPQGNSQIPNTPSLAGQPKLFIENQLVLIRDGMRDAPRPFPLSGAPARRRSAISPRL